MTERGSTLLTVLWLLVILSTAGATVLSKARVGHMVSGNRMILRRAEWAEEACLEILMARFHNRTVADASTGTMPQDTVQLGHGTWCRAHVEVAGARMDFNALTPELLQHVLGDARVVNALLDWTDADSVTRPAGAERAWYVSRGRRPPRNRPVADVSELALILGFDPERVRHLAALFTIGGDATIDPNEAPRELLLLLPGLDAAGVEAMLARRHRGQRMTTMEQFLEALPSGSRAGALANYLALAQRVDLSGRTLRVDVEAGVAGWRPRAHARLRMRISEGRLAVLQRQMQ